MNSKSSGDSTSLKYFLRKRLEALGSRAWRLMTGTRMKMAPTMRWLTRMAWETPGKALASAGTNTNRPEIASRVAGAESTTERDA